MAVETAAQRYDREFVQMKGTRKARALDAQSTERKERLFVDRETGDSAVS